MNEFEESSGEEILNKRKQKFLNIGKQKTITIFSKNAEWITKDNFIDSSKRFLSKIDKKFIAVLILLLLISLFLIK